MAIREKADAAEPAGLFVADDAATAEANSLSHRARVGVRGYGLWSGCNPSPGANAPTSPNGRGEERGHDVTMLNSSRPIAVRDRAAGAGDLDPIQVYLIVTVIFSETTGGLNG
jgi:hypothetical protein